MIRISIVRIPFWRAIMKNRLKRIATAVIAALILISCASCGSANNADDPEKPGETVGTAALRTEGSDLVIRLDSGGDPVKISVYQQNKDGTWKALDGFLAGTEGHHTVRLPGFAPGNDAFYEGAGDAILRYELSSDVKGEIIIPFTLKDTSRLTFSRVFFKDAELIKVGKAVLGYLVISNERMDISGMSADMSSNKIVSTDTVQVISICAEVN